MFTLVGAVPSGFTLVGVRLTGLAFAAGVVFATGEDAAAVVVFFTGALLTALAGCDCAAPVVGFLRMGRGFVVPRGVRWRAGLEASLTGVLPVVTGVFFTGVVVEAGLLAEAAVTGFLTGVEDAVGVAFTGVVFTGVEADAPAALSFLGTLFAGAAAVPAVSVAVATGLFTGVALVADVAVFAGVVDAGFDAVDPATLEMFPILAERALAPVLYIIYQHTLQRSILLLELVHGRHIEITTT